MYLITPVFNEGLRVKLHFNEKGESYFVNEFNGMSQSGINAILELQQTQIEGFLLPFEEPRFYPFDINLFNGRDISKLDYYSGSKRRLEYLMNTVRIIEPHQVNIEIKTNFDLNIVQGAEYYLTNPEVSGLLFINFIGSEIFSWNDNSHGTITVSLNFNKIEKNRWRVSVNGESIPSDLLPQGPDNDVELPAKFTKGNPDSLIILCEVNIKQTSYTIENRKPLIPIKQLDEHVTTYDEVINILKSIKNPISRSVFTSLNKNPLGFAFNGKIYEFNAINQPLTIK